MLMNSLPLRPSPLTKGHVRPRLHFLSGILSDFRERRESGLSWWNTGSSSLGNMMINWETEHLLGTITNNLETSILNLKYKFELGNLTFECL